MSGGGIGLTQAEKEEIGQKIKKMMEGCPLSQLEKAWIRNDRPARAARELAGRTATPVLDAMKVVVEWSARMKEELRLLDVIDETRRA